ncbi:MAG TPA: tetratricopeptide repeat protein [Pyrinomonadaceae bacterium]|jgi:tetratricopeptide (TPR) repeat protein
MKKILLSVCLILCGLVAPAGAQFNKSESARKAGERLARGDRAGAIAVLDKAIEQRKDLQETYGMRARLRAQTGDLDGAIADFGEAIKLTPHDVALYEQRAMYRLFKRDSAGALQDYDAAIANGLKSEKVYVGRASVKRDTGDVEGAILDYQSAIAVNPMLASAYVGLAHVLEQKGETDAAITFLQDFLDRYEGKRGGKLPSIKGDTQQAVSSMSIKREGQEKDGGQVYLQGMGTTTVFKGGTPEEMQREMARQEQLMNLAGAYGNLGGMYARKNDLERALENFAKGLQINPGLPYIYKQRSDVRLKRGDLKGTIEDLNVVVNSPMSLPDRHLDKGLLLVLQGRDDEAEKEFALHLQAFPQATRESLDTKIEAAKKLRAPQAQP